MSSRTPQFPPADHTAPQFPPADHTVGPRVMVAAPKGVLPWALGFLLLMPIPFLGAIVSGVCMAASGGASRRAGGVARENARSALNWGLTYLAVSTILLVTHFVMLFTIAKDAPVAGFFPFGIPITLYGLLGLLHLVLVIVGTVRASGRKAMRVPFAIPFQRR